MSGRPQTDVQTCANRWGRAARPRRQDVGSVRATAVRSGARGPRRGVAGVFSAIPKAVLCFGNPPGPPARPPPPPPARRGAKSCARLYTMKSAPNENHFVPSSIPSSTFLSTFLFLNTVPGFQKNSKGFTGGNYAGQLVIRDLPRSLVVKYRELQNS